jgi:hypothetical protein
MRDGDESTNISGSGVLRQIGEFTRAGRSDAVGGYEWQIFQRLEGRTLRRMTRVGSLLILLHQLALEHAFNQRLQHTLGK